MRLAGAQQRKLGPSPIKGGAREVALSTWAIPAASRTDNARLNFIHDANARYLAIYGHARTGTLSYSSIVDSGTSGIKSELAGRCRDQGAAVGSGTAADTADCIVGPVFISLGR